MRKVKNIILHVGPDKTGSTAIQKTFSDNKDYFDSLGVVCGPFKDKLISVSFCGTKDRARKLFNVDESEWLSASKRFRDGLKNKVELSRADTLFLSHEGLVHLNEVELKQLYAFLQGIGDRVYVVMYARCPVSYATSAMSQRVKTGRISWSSRQFPVLNYKNYLERFIVVFGRHNVNVRLFDFNRFPSGDVVLDFLSIPIFNDLCGFEKNKLVSNFAGNSSLSNLGVEVGDRISSILAGEKLSQNGFKRLFAESLLSLKGEKIRLKAYQVKIILIASKRHVNFLNREFDIFFPESSAEASKNLSRAISCHDTELMALRLISSCLPEYRMPLLRRFWRKFLCWGQDAFNI